MPLPEYTGILGYRRAAHLLHRASFGATKEEIDNFATLTPTLALAKLFQQSLPDPILPIDPKTGKEWFISGTTDANSGDSDLQEYFKGWLLGQMLGVGINPALSLAYSAREKMVFFIHTILTVIQSKVDSSRSLYFQNQLYRLFALDKSGDVKINFKELTKKVSVDNAMLKLLDGNLNIKGSPNENYARELHELYTIGRGLEGHLPPTTDPGDYFLYREQDVQAAAKVLSGWDMDITYSNIDLDTKLPRGKVRGNATNASGHDNDPKQFSDRFANQIIQADPALLAGSNATEASALDEISQLIDMIYSKPETARNICRRIYRFFVYHDITTAIDETIIAELANSFTANGFKLQPVLEELFKSQHFYDAAAGVNDDNFGGIIKSPLDLTIGTLRLFDVQSQLPDPITDATGFYEKTNELIRSLTNMGMHFYDPYDVAGYDAYHQYPIYHRSWISTNYLTSRYEFINQLVSQNQNMPGALKIDPYSFVKSKIDDTTAGNARNLIIELAKYLLPQAENLTFDTTLDDNSGLTAERMNYFLTAFLKSPQIDADPEAAWTDRWSHPYEPEVVPNQLASLFNAMMQSPEYQLY